MIVGHFATALIANQKYPKGTLLFFLVLSQLQDLVWYTFHFLGLERTTPNDMFEASLGNIAAEMIYSHDLLPQLAWILIAFGLGKLLFKSNKIALISAVIVFGHFALDFISGFPHYVFGHDTHQVGLGYYYSNPYLAIVIEILATALLLWYFFKEEVKHNIKRTTKNKVNIIGVFAFGIGFLLFTVEKSMRETLGIPEFDVPFNTTIPTLLFTYLTMTFYLNYFVKRVK